MRHQLGLSLIELMIAMTIGLVLTVAIGQIYLGTRSVYRVTENNARIQENGRYIMEELSRDIRMAGYLGCAKDSSVNNLVSTGTSWVKFTEALRAYDSVPASPAPSIGVTAADVRAGTDVIRIQRAGYTGTQLDGNLDSDNANIQVDDNGAGFKTGDVFIISDCVKTDVFEASTVSNGSGKVTVAHANNVNLDNKLSKAYQERSDIMRFVNNLYYIGTGANDCPPLALCRKELQGNTLSAPRVLADNVENMQVKVGEDVNADGDGIANHADRFVNPSNVTNWNNVVSVRVELLLVSAENNLTTSAQSPVYDGSTLSVTDKKLRRVYASTITLRNRAP